MARRRQGWNYRIAQGQPDAEIKRPMIVYYNENEPFAAE
jgi:hypothetical protein